jgi:hypothetical protein
MELFIKPVEFEKTAYLRVSENPTEWTRDIMENFYNEFPFFINYPVRVEFKQRDEQKGYAVGVIHVEHSNGIVVPIIIQNRELFPFDVCILNGQTLPLTNYTINAYIASKTPFMSTVKRETGDITTMLFNSGGMGYMREMPTETYKTAEASLLDKVLPNTSEEERKVVLEQIADERVTEGFKVNGNTDIVLKIAACTANPPAIEKTASIVEKLLNKDIWYIYKESEFNYHGLFGNHSVADTFECDLNADQVAAFKGKLIKTAVVEDKEKSEGETPLATLSVVGADHDLAVMEDGRYIKIPKGVLKHVPNKAKLGDPVKEHVGAMKVGEAFTQPFHVDSVVTINGIKYVNGSSSLQKYAFAITEDDYTGVEDGGTYVKPNSFIKLGKEESAVPNVGKKGYQVKKTSGGYISDIFGSNPIDEHQAAWSLIQHGATTDDITNLGAMKEGDIAFIQGEALNPSTTINKIAAEYDALTKEECDAIKGLCKNFIKEASIIPDNPTVDKVLSLNFVNKDTLGSFIQSVPLLENAAFTIADLLVKARLGVQLIDEAALRKVMYGLLEIIEVLKGAKGLKK